MTGPTLTAKRPGVWEAHAACADVGTDAFFPTAESPTHDVARKICGGCPVQAECADHGIRNETFGIWGGLSERQLREARRRLGIVLRDDYLERGA